MTTPKVVSIWTVVVGGKCDVPTVDGPCLYVEIGLSHETDADKTFHGALFKHKDDTDAQNQRMAFQLVAMLTDSMKEQGLLLPAETQTAILACVRAQWPSVPAFTRSVA